MRVLILAAHADDECLGAGGTIAKHSAEGREVWIGVLADGQTSRGPSSLLAVQRFKQLKKVAVGLGAYVYQENAPFPDQRMDALPVLEIAQVIETMVSAIKPDIVYTHHIGDLNQDHRAVAHATLIATRPTPDCSVKEVYAYEVPSSTEWAFGMEPFRPTTFMDISGEYLEKKIQAMEMYESERRPSPHPRSSEALRALAMWRGAQAGLMAAEAFQLVRSVR